MKIKKILAGIFVGCILNTSLLPINSAAENTAAEISVYRNYSSFYSKGFLVSYDDYWGGMVVYGYDGNSKKVNIPSKINGVPVVKIGDNAFYENTAITSVTIPKTVTTIGQYSFMNCSQLKSVNLPANLNKIDWYAFKNCAKLTSISFPDSVTYIGCNSFEGCTKLNKISFPKNETTIGSSAFKDCSSLTTVTVPDSVSFDEFEDSYVFLDCKNLKITYKGKTYGYYKNGILTRNGILIDCLDSAKKVTIPKTVHTIGINAFKDCTQLTSVTIPNSVTKIDHFAFQNCTELTKVTLPQTVSTIGRSAFSGCISLKKINIPKGITEINNSTFENCKSLSNITLSNSVSVIDRKAFIGCSGLKSIKIPNTITHIGSYSFSGCSSLTTMSIPDDASWEPNAFIECENLQFTFKGKTSKCYENGLFIYDQRLIDCLNNRKRVVIPATAQWIEPDAFKDCTLLKSVTIPETVIEIKYNAFHNCSSLKNLTIPDDTKFDITAFIGCENLKYKYKGKTTTCYKNGLLISDNTLYHCLDGIKKVVIPDNVTSVQIGTFNDCYTATSIILPESINYFSDGLDNLKKVRITYKSSIYTKAQIMELP